MALLLNERQIRSLLPMAKLIDAMEHAVTAFSSGAVEQPVRTVLEVGRDRNFFGVMPAYVAPGPDRPEALGAKLVTFFISNAALGLHTHCATILLLDPKTGALQAVLDGRYLTEARTAAVSAVSARWLARPDSKRLAIIGSGVQARSHLEALSHVFRFESVAAWGPTKANLDRFCDETGATPAPSVEAAVRDADIIVTVSAARDPIVRGEWIRPGAHVIAVGACRAAHRELDTALVARARVVVDSRAAAMKEAGDILIPIAEGAINKDHIRAELGERPRRQSPDEVTLFKSLGMAVEDVVAANVVYERATGEGVGSSFEF